MLIGYLLEKKIVITVLISFPPSHRRNFQSFSFVCFLLFQNFRYLAQITHSILSRFTFPFFLLLLLRFSPQLAMSRLHIQSGTVSTPSMAVFFCLFFFLLLQFSPQLAMSRLHIQILRLSIHTRCFSGGFWPKYCGYQSALGAFRVASGLNIAVIDPH